MQKKYINCGNISVCIEFPVCLLSIIKFLYPYASDNSACSVDVEITVNRNKTGCYEILQDGKLLCANLSENLCVLSLCNEVVRAIAQFSHRHIAFHAGALSRNGRAIILPAKTGKGKTSLAAWMISKGYNYLTDELVLFDPVNKEFEAFYRPLNIKTQGLDALEHLLDYFRFDSCIETDSVTLTSVIDADHQAEFQNALKAGLLIFPDYFPESQLQIEPLTPAQTGLALMACNINARNLDSHGFNHIAEIARHVPSMRLTYSRFEQLEELLVKLIDLIMASSFDMKFLSAIVNAGAVNQQNQKQKISSNPVPKATAAKGSKKLCVGMATYDDYDGVYFTTQALRLYHPEVIGDIEILVVDNHPTGDCAQALKALDGKVDNLRYLPVIDKYGTAVRDVIFEHASSEYVMCIDCHVFIEPGAIKKLISYFDANSKTDNLLQGPMYSDDLKHLFTHFDPIWRNGMYGVWAFDQRGAELDAPAFEIPMQGLGLFASRKQSWPGFNQNFRGFGGEEGYIHEKYRRRGHAALCLPFLRWTHRFARPLGVPYCVNWVDRIRNYLIGFSELGLDINPVIKHFNEHAGENLTLDVLRSFKTEFYN